MIYLLEKSIRPNNITLNALLYLFINNPKFNIYLYDGDHKEICHYKALTHYIDCMDRKFIYIIDDWNWKFVRDGTQKAIEDLKLKTLFKYNFEINKLILYKAAILFYLSHLYNKYNN